MARHKTHIAFTQRHLDSGNGGEERSLFSILQNWDTTKSDLTLFYKMKGDFNRQLPKEVNQFQLLENELNSRNFLVFILSISRAFLIIKKNEISRIHVNHYKDITWAAILSKLTSVPVSCHLRLNAPDYLSRQYKWGLNQCDKFIANSHFVKKDWEKYITKKITVVHNAIELPKEIPFISEEVDLLYVGRIVPEKGLDIILKALIELQDRHLTVIGDFNDDNMTASYEYKNRIFKIIEENHLEDRITFKGNLSNPYGFISKATCMIIPSFHDAFGRTFMEAITLNTNFRISRTGGIIDLCNEYPELLPYTFEEGNSKELNRSFKQNCVPKQLFEKLNFNMETLLKELANCLLND